MTLIIGPNNSGKSKFLQEIFWTCKQYDQHSTSAILSDIIFNPIENAETVVEEMYVPESHDPDYPSFSILRGNTFRCSQEKLLQVLKSPQDNRKKFCEWYSIGKTLMLDGATRLNQIAGVQIHSFEHQPQSCLQLLVLDDEKRHEIRKILHDAFGKYFVINPTQLGHLNIGFFRSSSVRDQGRNWDIKRLNRIPRKVSED